MSIRTAGVVELALGGQLMPENVDDTARGRDRFETPGDSGLAALGHGTALSQALEADISYTIDESLIANTERARRMDRAKLSNVRGLATLCRRYK